jgi:hypothetical protein
MKYLLLTYLDEQAWNGLGEIEQQRLIREGTQFARVLQSSGKYLGGSPLESSASATSVRVREHRRLVTDGPFAETREQLGGYSLVEVQTREEAIDIAAKLIGEGPATVEVRPVRELVGLPAADCQSQ